MGQIQRIRYSDAIELNAFVAVSNIIYHSNDLKHYRICFTDYGRSNQAKP